MADKFDPKKVRLIEQNGSSYYMYPFSKKDTGGKDKKIYGKSEEELRDKVMAFYKEMRAVPEVQTTLLKDYVDYWAKKSFGIIETPEIVKILNLFNVMVYGSLNTDISKITLEDMQNFYRKMQREFPFENVQRIDSSLRAVFEYAKKDGIENFDFSEIPPCTEQDCGSEMCPVEYLPTAEQQKHLLEYCRADTNTKRSSWLLVFTLMTGLLASKAVKIQYKDCNFANKQVTVSLTKNVFPFLLNDEVISWLKSIIVERAVEEAVKNKCLPETLERYGMTSDMVDAKNPVQEQVVFNICNNPQYRDIFIANYMEQKPENYIFVNKNFKPVIINNLQHTLDIVCRKCGLPSGITPAALHKAFIAKELEEGKSIDNLKKRYGYVNKVAINKIKAAYDLRKLLF
ncbi:MAG: tyrosine-type recombinase/integrase [Ruminococcus sp.]|nr:tyrosine-type recombinase/integrase [Ruminococcus sp.]